MSDFLNIANLKSTKFNLSDPVLFPDEILTVDMTVCDLQQNEVQIPFVATVVYGQSLADYADGEKILFYAVDTENDHRFSICRDWDNTLPVDQIEKEIADVGVDGLTLNLEDIDSLQAYQYFRVGSNPQLYRITSIDDITITFEPALQVVTLPGQSIFVVAEHTGLATNNLVDKRQEHSSSGTVLFMDGSINFEELQYVLKKLIAFQAPTDLVGETLSLTKHAKVGPLRVGTTLTGGLIRFENDVFQGYDGSVWKDLGSSEGSLSLPTGDDGSMLALSGGDWGITPAIVIGADEIVTDRGMQINGNFGNDQLRVYNMTDYFETLGQQAVLIENRLAFLGGRGDGSVAQLTDFVSYSIPITKLEVVETSPGIFSDPVVDFGVEFHLAKVIYLGGGIVDMTSVGAQLVLGAFTGGGYSDPVPMAQIEAGLVDIRAIATVGESYVGGITLASPTITFTDGNRTDWLQCMTFEGTPVFIVSVQAIFNDDVTFISDVTGGNSGGSFTWNNYLKTRILQAITINQYPSPEVGLIVSHAGDGLRFCDGENWIAFGTTSVDLGIPGQMNSTIFYDPDFNGGTWRAAPGFRLFANGAIFDNSIILGPKDEFFAPTAGMIEYDNNDIFGWLRHGESLTRVSLTNQVARDQRLPTTVETIGALLFYNTYEGVWDASHEIFANGAGLVRILANLQIGGDNDLRGMIRWNADNQYLEWHDANNWIPFSGAGEGEGPTVSIPVPAQPGALLSVIGEPGDYAWSESVIAYISGNFFYAPSLRSEMIELYDNFEEDPVITLDASNGTIVLQHLITEDLTISGHLYATGVELDAATITDLTVTNLTVLQQSNQAKFAQLDLQATNGALFSLFPTASTLETRVAGITIGYWNADGLTVTNFNTGRLTVTEGIFTNTIQIGDEVPPGLTDAAGMIRYNGDFQGCVANENGDISWVSFTLSLASGELDGLFGTALWWNGEQWFRNPNVRYTASGVVLMAGDSTTPATPGAWRFNDVTSKFEYCVEEGVWQDVGVPSGSGDTVPSGTISGSHLRWNGSAWVETPALLTEGAVTQVRQVRLVPYETFGGAGTLSTGIAQGATTCVILNASSIPVVGQVLTFANNATAYEITDIDATTPSAIEITFTPSATAQLPIHTQVQYYQDFVKPQPLSGMLRFNSNDFEGYVENIGWVSFTGHRSFLPTTADNGNLLRFDATNGIWIACQNVEFLNDKITIGSRVAINSELRIQNGIYGEYITLQDSSRMPFAPYGSLAYHNGSFYGRVSRFDANLQKYTSTWIGMGSRIFETDPVESQTLVYDGSWWVNTDLFTLSTETNRTACALDHFAFDFKHAGYDQWAFETSEETDKFVIECQTEIVSEGNDPVMTTVPSKVLNFSRYYQWREGNINPGSYPDNYTENWVISQIHVHPVYRVLEDHYTANVMQKLIVDPLGTVRPETVDGQLVDDTRLTDNFLAHVEGPARFAGRVTAPVITVLDPNQTSIFVGSVTVGGDITIAGDFSAGSGTFESNVTITDGYINVHTYGFFGSYVRVGYVEGAGVIGAIRYSSPGNATRGDFEGWDGEQWISMTGGFHGRAIEGQTHAHGLVFYNDYTGAYMSQEIATFESSIATLAVPFLRVGHENFDDFPVFDVGNGALFYKDSTSMLYLRSGGAWHTIAGGSDTLPAGTVDGDMLVYSGDNWTINPGLHFTLLADAGMLVTEVTNCLQIKPYSGEGLPNDTEGIGPGMIVFHNNDLQTYIQDVGWVSLLAQNIVVRAGEHTNEFAWSNGNGWTASGSAFKYQTLEINPGYLTPTLLMTPTRLDQNWWIDETMVPADAQSLHLYGNLIVTDGAIIHGGIRLRWTDAKNGTINITDAGAGMHTTSIGSSWRLTYTDKIGGVSKVMPVMTGINAIDSANTHSAFLYYDRDAGTIVNSAKLYIDTSRICVEDLYFRGTSADRGYIKYAARPAALAYYLDASVLHVGISEASSLFFSAGKIYTPTMRIETFTSSDIQVTANGAATIYFDVQAGQNHVWNAGTGHTITIGTNGGSNAVTIHKLESASPVFTGTVGITGTVNIVGDLNVSGGYFSSAFRSSILTNRLQNTGFLGVGANINTDRGIGDIKYTGAIRGTVTGKTVNGNNRVQITLSGVSGTSETRLDDYLGTFGATPPYVVSATSGVRYDILQIVSSAENALVLELDAATADILANDSVCYYVPGDWQGWSGQYWISLTQGGSGGEGGGSTIDGTTVRGLVFNTGNDFDTAEGVRLWNTSQLRLTADETDGQALGVIRFTGTDLQVFTLNGGGAGRWDSMVKPWGMTENTVTGSLFTYDLGTGKPRTTINMYENETGFHVNLPIVLGASTPTPSAGMIWYDSVAGKVKVQNATGDPVSVGFNWLNGSTDNGIAFYDTALSAWNTTTSLKILDDQSGFILPTKSAGAATTGAIRREGNYLNFQNALGYFPIPMLDSRVGACAVDVGGSIGATQVTIGVLNYLYCAGIKVKFSNHDTEYTITSPATQFPLNNPRVVQFTPALTNAVSTSETVYVVEALTSGQILVTGADGRTLVPSYGELYLSGITVGTYPGDDYGYFSSGSYSYCIVTQLEPKRIVMPTQGSAATESNSISVKDNILYFRSANGTLYNLCVPTVGSTGITVTGALNGVVTKIDTNGTIAASGALTIVAGSPNLIKSTYALQLLTQMGAQTSTGVIYRGTNDHLMYVLGGVPYDLTPGDSGTIGADYYNSVRYWLPDGTGISNAIGVKLPGGVNLTTTGYITVGTSLSVGSGGITVAGNIEANDVYAKTRVRLANGTQPVVGGQNSIWVETGKLYFKNSSNTVYDLTTAASAPVVPGSNQRVIVGGDSAGTLASYSELTFVPTSQAPNGEAILSLNTGRVVLKKLHFGTTSYYGQYYNGFPSTTNSAGLQQLQVLTGPYPDNYDAGIFFTVKSNDGLYRTRRLAFADELALDQSYRGARLIVRGQEYAFGELGITQAGVVYIMTAYNLSGYVYSGQSGYWSKVTTTSTTQP